ncbi:hypothetical protein Hanom_Chr12g01109591 [Helianthus anomalus]
MSISINSTRQFHNFADLTVFYDIILFADMEDDNDLEQLSGSPTAGENEFVHVESVDSAQTDSGLVNQDDVLLVRG